MKEMSISDVAETRCPECTAGKCGNCDGSSWSGILDSTAACPCSVNGHPSLRDRAEAEAKVAELSAALDSLKASSVPTASVGCGPSQQSDVPGSTRVDGVLGGRGVDPRLGRRRRELERLFDMGLHGHASGPRAVWVESRLREEGLLPEPGVLVGVIEADGTAVTEAFRGVDSPPRRDRWWAAMQAGLDAVLRLADEERAATWADASATLNDHADVWEQDGSDPCRVRVCREMANAFRTYAEGVGLPAIDSLRQKRAKAERERDEARAIVDRIKVLADEFADGESQRTVGDWLNELRAAIEGQQ